MAQGCENLPLSMPCSTHSSPTPPAHLTPGHSGGTSRHCRRAPAGAGAAAAAYSCCCTTTILVPAGRLQLWKADTRVELGHVPLEMSALIKKLWCGCCCGPPAAERDCVIWTGAERTIGRDRGEGVSERFDDYGGCCGRGTVSLACVRGMRGCTWTSKSYTRIHSLAQKKQPHAGSCGAAKYICHAPPPNPPTHDTLLSP